MNDVSAHVAFLDRYYGRQRRFYDFSRRFFLFGRNRLLRALDVRPGHYVLDMGCGTARNLRKLAGMQPDAACYGIDASSEMLQTATQKIAADGLERRITLKRALAEEVAPGRTFGLERGFDRVFFSYSLSMMPDWRGPLQAALDSLAPGGKLAIVDFWDFAGYPGWLARRLARRLHDHHVHFEPAVLEHLRGLERSGKAVLKLRPVARRWAYLAELTLT